jgi:hypothetical protein
MKKWAAFGSDFVTAWMIFIFFLQRIIVNYGPGARKYVWCALFVVIFTLSADALLNRYIATAERQAGHRRRVGPHRLLWSNQVGDAVSGRVHKARFSRSTLKNSHVRFW